MHTNTQIRTAVQDGHIVCVPFHDSRLTAQGLQLGLGSYYYRTEQSGPALAHNPYDTEDIERYFEGPFRALPHAEQSALSGLKPLAGIAADHPVILLGPGERIVTHTHEFIGIAPSYSAYLQELPAWRQSGIVITPGHPAPSAVARLSLVVQNVNAHKTVLLPVGAPIIQIVFSGDAAAGNGTTEELLDSVQTDRAINLWTPSSILAARPAAPLDPPARIQGLHYE